MCIEAAHVSSFWQDDGQICPPVKILPNRMTCQELSNSSRRASKSRIPKVEQDVVKPETQTMALEPTFILNSARASQSASGTCCMILGCEYRSK